MSLTRPRKCSRYEINVLYWLLCCDSEENNTSWVMQEHEQALIAAIARLADTSDGELGNNKKTILGFVCNLRIIFYLPFNSVL